MGGSVNFCGIEKEKKWLKIFKESIAGQFRNVYSTKDMILVGYSLTANDYKESSGLKDVKFIKQIEKDSPLCLPEDTMDFKNVNASDFVTLYNDGGMELVSADHH